MLSVHKTLNYLEDFLTEEDFEEAETFLAEEDFLALEDLQEELLFELHLDLLQLLICSTAIDHKYSSWPCGQPAFCQMK